MLEVYIDGACGPINPGGTAAYGVVVYRHSTLVGPEIDTYGPRRVTMPLPKVKVWEDCRIVGTGPDFSNNVAEYAGLIAFLQWFDNQYVEDVVIRSDSRMLINQMNGTMKIRKGLYVQYANRALAYRITNAEIWKDRIKFEWIPKEKNTIADNLANSVLDKILIRRE